MESLMGQCRIAGIDEAQKFGGRVTNAAVAGGWCCKYVSIAFAG
ncbi:hypothetical protein Y88_1185 [Novosphingobium nitrogenifigens DSM 19370]|uniref:Uncharacterized protein n=1 Tax=Novosphingobium nitrogenifigens DSM 19370 TaxID=983920 RepID=F1Z8A2_9SPHN|nr:hypothetical protein Y88_1185 [Novosphingobium nitrogenifigens DSM 19370]